MSELLAAIHADPDDDAARMVYADWLTERGDPRGEFIALQLAGRHTAREAELLEAHGRAWLGPIARVVGAYAFRRGFLAAATIVADDAEAFADPAWATVEELDFEMDHGLELLQLPALHTLRRIPYEAMVALVTGPVRPRLRDVGFIGSNERRRIDETASLPNVRRLSVFDSPIVLRCLLGGRLGRQLDRITFLEDATMPDLADLVAVVEELGLAVPELAAAGEYGDELVLDRRTRTLHATIHRAWWLPRQLAGLAGRADEVRAELVGAGPSESEIREIERTIVEVGLRAELPWERFTDQQLPAGVYPLVAHVRSVGRAHLAGLVDLAMAPPIALVFDSFEVDAQQHLPLAGGPAQVRTLFDSAPRSLHLYGAGRRETCGLRLDRDGYAEVTSAYAGGAEATIAWFVRTLEAIPWTDAGIQFCVPTELWFYPSPPYWNQWLHALPASIDPILPLRELEAIAPRSIRVRDGLVVVLGDAPDRPPSAAQFEAYMRAVHDASWRRRGIRPHDIFVDRLGDRLEAAGLARVAMEMRDTLAGDVVYARDRCSVSFGSTIWTATMEARIGASTGGNWQTFAEREIRSAEDVHALCDAVQVDEIVAWFDVMRPRWR